MSRQRARPKTSAKIPDRLAVNGGRGNGKPPRWLAAFIYACLGIAVLLTALTVGVSIATIFG